MISIIHEEFMYKLHNEKLKQIWELSIRRLVNTMREFPVEK